MANKAFNYDFVMYLEGVKIPFKSAMIVSTPNGTEANVNLTANRHAYNIKPKTSIQIFYKDMVDLGDGKGWRLMFDGFTSGFVKDDQATEGRGLAIKCRDFRMDMRKAPAAISWQGAQEIAPQVHYTKGGLYHTIVDRAANPNQDRSDTKKIPIRTFDNSGIHDLAFMMKRISRTATGKNFKDLNPDEQGKGKTAYQREFPDGIALSEADVEYGISDSKRKDKIASGSFFLDAVVRGMWSEAIGGTSVVSFINKRTRIDKRFLIPKNKSGYSFWSRNNLGLQAGNVIMGNSRFSSVEAAIMRLAGLFSVRVYSCSTPSLIPVDDKEQTNWIMDPDVKRFLVDDHSDSFGAKYILNESMLLPPLEFTAPPNCNLVFPPMFDKISWNIDIDSDITRGYFSKVDTLSIKGNGPSLSSGSVQIPTTLFDTSTDKENKGKTDKELKEIKIRKKPPLTLEERYKGVSVYNGNVEMLLAGNDAAGSFLPVHYLDKDIAVVNDRISKAKAFIAKLKKNKKKASKALTDSLNAAQKQQKEFKERRKAKLASLRALEDKKTSATDTALDRHALIKYLNRKYSGRVADVEMQFNPYLMAGFPSIVFADDDPYGGEAVKSVVGMVQVVKHSIYISNGAGDARTSISLNNARYLDEPTDMDDDGFPLYMSETDQEKAKVNDSLRYDSDYKFPEGKPPVKRDFDNNIYELAEDQKITDDSEYRYARDFLTLSDKAIANKEKNSVYLDEEYMPNKISRFYRDVLRHRKDNPHFMVGHNEGGNFSFMYDTIHEAADSLKTRKKELFYDYESCVKYIQRDVCSADAFYQAIVGASILTNKNEDGETLDKDGNVIGKDSNNKPAQATFKVFQNKYDHKRIFDRYHGVTTSIFNSGESYIEARKVDNGKKGTMKEAGEFSSIREHLPITAFIKERREAVEAYKKEAEKRANGVQYANR